MQMLLVHLVAGGGRSGEGGGPATSPQTIDGSGNTPDSGIGYPGGSGYVSGQYFPPGGQGGGGGGAGGAGTSVTSPSSPAGKGGLGRAAFLGDTGIPPSYGTPGPSSGRWFAGGGGGGNHDGTPNPGVGGSAPDGGGGGAGSPSTSSFTGTVVTAHTGSGGGGGGGLANSYPGGDVPSPSGAAGILIVRVPTSILS